MARKPKEQSYFQILAASVESGFSSFCSVLWALKLSEENGERGSTRYTLTERVLGVFLDWPVWIGLLWVSSRYHERRKAASLNDRGDSSSLAWWQAVSDLSFVGLMLGIRYPKSPPYEANTDEDIPNKLPTPKENGVPVMPTNLPDGSASESFLRQIESNLGLTPNIHNRSGRPDNSLVSGGRMLSLDESTSQHGSSSLERPLTTPASPAPPPQQRYLEVMVHNVSHTDLVLSLKSLNEPKPTSQEDSFSLCRPRFSAFDAYSRRVLDALSSTAGDLASQLISFPRYQRSEGDRQMVASASSNALTKDASLSANVPIGFSLEHFLKGETTNEQLSVSPDELNDLRLRGRDAPLIDKPNSPFQLNAAFFPLLGTLLPQWQARLQEKYQNVESTYGNRAPQDHERQPCKKVIILVSGVGSPRNWTHSMDGNSTEHCAKLMELFIKSLYPEVDVVRVHSNTNLFRYDENISFVQNELLPCIQGYRDAHATGLPYPDELPPSNGKRDFPEKVDHIAFDPDWKKSVNIILSFADGSPARNHAIQAALRSYKPTYFHCWQLKTFWHEMKIVDSDIEVHTFEEMETLPPIDLTTPLSTQKLHQQQPIAMQVVKEMKAFKIQMEYILQNVEDDEHDLRSFWLRKTKKPVLAVLAVQMTKGGPIKLYRGTNMEVSMPTGSLCAERNVIGTALADNPTLKRHHLKTIAVLSVRSSKIDSVGTRSRATSTNSLTSFAGASAVGSRSNSIDQKDPAGRPPRPPFSQNDESSDWIMQDIAPPDPPRVDSVTKLDSASLDGEIVSTAPENVPVSPSTTPARRISLYQHNSKDATLSKDSRHGTTNKRKSVVVVKSAEDLNPLRPCGACNEWLKKISESSPYFQILTFTDTDCSGVYCTPVAD